MSRLPADKLSLKNLYTLKSFFQMVCGVLFAVFAVKGFLLPNKFFDGGVTGVALLIHELIHVDFSPIVLVLNLLFFIPAYKYVGKQFAVRSFIAVIVLAIGVQFLDIPSVTSDKLLIATFGGCFLGLGMGLVIRSGGVLDGIEIMALFTTRRIGFSMSEITLFLNLLLLLAIMFHLGIETVMYSTITFFTALKMADYVVDGIEEYISLTVISRESDKVKSLLVNYFGKGITVYKGERGYLPTAFEDKTDCDIIVIIITRLEIISINEEISKIDPTAFIYINSIKETRGGIMKKRSHH